MPEPCNGVLGAYDGGIGLCRDETRQLAPGRAGKGRGHSVALSRLLVKTIKPCGLIAAAADQMWLQATPGRHFVSLRARCIPPEVEGTARSASRA